MKLKKALTELTDNERILLSQSISNGRQTIEFNTLTALTIEPQIMSTVDLLRAKGIVSITHSNSENTMGMILSPAYEMLKENPNLIKVEDEQNE